MKLCQLRRVFVERHVGVEEHDRLHREVPQRELVAKAVGMVARLSVHVIAALYCGVPL